MKEICSTPAEIQALLESLRWGPDMVITNPFGEVVWLTECFDERGKRTGITDCCFASDPCAYHTGKYVQ